ncbi:DUF1499 domain-containing protein [Pelagibius sp. Alg239-R121]|uniref:DUF1499 domain-containing protein n=1 Tax=Pelagibius sp. Alg239-R121 TaxID=2993448 RepID=UPI0024A6BAB1|nr:DUF1499 domain-containing protein [Pelagibius sp. Alg239-R121]
MIKILVTGFKWLFGLLIAAALALAIVMAIIGRENTWAVLFGAPPLDVVDFATLEPRATPNSFLLCPENFCAKRPPDRASSVYDVSQEQLVKIVRKVVESTEGLRRDDRERPKADQSSQPPPAMQWDYVATTRHMKFPDLITIRILEAGDGKSSLVIYSRAVYGRKDFGANQNRIAAWIEAIEIAVAKQASTSG